MSSQPAPPPPPPAAGDMSGPSQVAGGSRQDARNTISPARSRPPSSSPNGLLSSQQFKDELAVSQARLSPNPDSQLSIDERIQRRKAAAAAATAASNQETLNGDAMAGQSLPDKLLGPSSSLQRNKRPFAYSPDVNDPNNRGKLDLSQIKSAAMRRRLLANMEDEPAATAEVEVDDYGEEREAIVAAQRRHARDRPRGEFCTSPVVSCERVAIRLLDADAPQQPASYHTCEQPPTVRIRQRKELKAATLGRPQHRPKEVARPASRERQPPAPTSPPIVHYSQPPTFYQAPEISPAFARASPQPAHHQPGDPAGGRQPPTVASAADYLSSLDAEIAESLESLSLLASSLDSRQSATSSRSNGSSAPPPAHRNEPWWHHRAPSPAPLRNNNAERAPTIAANNGGPKQNCLSTFQPTPGERPAGGGNQPAGHCAPSFYATLPSGRQATDYCAPDYSSSAHYFGASPASAGPYSISPYYGSPLDADERPTAPAAAAAAVALTCGRVNNRPTSHGTFGANQNNSTAEWHQNMAPARGVNAAPPNHDDHHQRQRQQHNHHHHYHNNHPHTQQPPPLLPSTSRHREGGDTAWERSGGCDDHHVRALREMTAKLDHEVNRLYNLDAWTLNR